MTTLTFIAGLFWIGQHDRLTKKQIAQAKRATSTAQPADGTSATN